jgi:proteasome assembly chaperone (PAC2) family protein
MAEELKLNHPWLVAVWPGMGNVALNAGVYLLAKLGMTVVAEFETGDLFDIDQVEVKNGILQPLRRPRNRFFVWSDPEKKRDLVVFIGEAQPPLNEMKQFEMEVLEDGNIGGLNGLLLGAAVEVDLHGMCILGEMPHVFSQLPFPKASLAILEVFADLARIDIDFVELRERAQQMEEQLGELWARVESQFRQQSGEDSFGADQSDNEEEAVKPADRERIEALFAEAIKNRSKAFELKHELDHLGLFKEYEDRFLYLFKESD